MPMDKKRYPKNWREIATAVKMLHDFNSARDLLFRGHNTTALDLVSLATRDYQKKLEALGVSVDE